MFDDDVTVRDDSAAGEFLGFKWALVMASADEVMAVLHGSLDPVKVVGPVPLDTSGAFRGRFRRGVREVVGFVRDFLSGKGRPSEYPHHDWREVVERLRPVVTPRGTNLWEPEAA